MRRPAITAGCLIMLAVIAAFYLPVLQGDYDMWWHLRYGEQYLSQHSWQIDHGRFSWTPARSDWKYGTWLGSTALYLIYHGLSMNGLIALRWLILALIFALLIIYLRIAGDSLDLSHLMWFALMLLIVRVNCTYIKPDRFSDLFLTILLFLYFHAKLTNRNLFSLFPLLLLLWVNVHGGFIIGLAVMTVLLVGETVNFIAWRKTRPDIALPVKLFGAFVLSIALSCAAVLVNPEGYSYPLALVREYATSGSAVHIALRSLREWSGLWEFLLPARNHAYFPFFSAAWSILLMALAVILSAIRAFRKEKFLDFAIIMLNCAIFVLSMKTNRAAFYFPVTAFFSIIYMLRKSGSLDIKKRIQAPSLAVVLMCSVTMFTLVATHYGPVDLQGNPGHEFVPEKEAEFIREHRLPGPLFNDYLVGGYLIWALYPDYRVFIDPRQGPYSPEVVEAYFSFSESASPVDSLRLLHQRFPFRTAIVHRSKLSILGAFLRSPEWKMVYFDKNALVFVERALYDDLPADVRDTYLGADRYADIKNPMILDWLYGMYGNRKEAEKICGYYRNNVSDLYIFKRQVLRSMEHNLATLR
jgi:hypothetical protein